MKRCEESLKRNESLKWIFFLFAFSECLTVMAPKARKNFSDAEKDTISRVHCFFEQELDVDRSLSIRNPRRRTHLATGVSETTVTRCVRRREQGGSNLIKKRKYNYHPYCISPNKIQNMQKRRRKKAGGVMGFECPTLVLEITDRNHEATRTRTKMHPQWSGRSTVSAGAKIRNKLVKPLKQTGQTLQNINYMKSS